MRNKALTCKTSTAYFDRANLRWICLRAHCQSFTSPATVTRLCQIAQSTFTMQDGLTHRLSHTAYLRDQSKLASEVMERHFRQVQAVDEDATTRGLSDAKQGAHEGGLATAGAPHYANLLPGFDAEGQPLQH